MEVKINTLVDDIYSLFRDGKQLDAEQLKLFGERVSAKAGSALADSLNERTRSLRLSNIGKPCSRQLWYEVNGTEGEALSPATLVKFTYGNILEELLLFLAEVAGHKVTNRQERVEVNGVVGHIDALIDGELVDVKSASSRSFERFERGELENNDSFGYIGQLAGYAEALGKDRGHFLVIDKTLGKILLYTVENLPSMTGRIDVLREQMNSDEPPVRAFSAVPDGKSGNMKLGVACSYCPYKATCWPSMRTFLYSTGPRFLVHTAYEPNVPEVKS